MRQWSIRGLGCCAAERKLSVSSAFLPGFLYEAQFSASATHRHSVCGVEADQSQTRVRTKGRPQGGSKRKTEPHGMRDELVLYIYTPSWFAQTQPTVQRGGMYRADWPRECGHDVGCPCRCSQFDCPVSPSCFSVPFAFFPSWPFLLRSHDGLSPLYLNPLQLNPSSGSGDPTIPRSTRALKKRVHISLTVPPLHSKLPSPVIAYIPEPGRTRAFRRELEVRDGLEVRPLQDRHAPRKPLNARWFMPEA